AGDTRGVGEDGEEGRGADPLWARGAIPVAATRASAPRTNRGRLVMVISSMPPFGFTPAHEPSERDGGYASLLFSCVLRRCPLFRQPAERSARLSSRPRRPSVPAPREFCMSRPCRSDTARPTCRLTA